MTIDQLYEMIRILPLAERLQLVERVVHDVANVASTAQEPPSGLLGLFADEPELIDRICADALDERRNRPWRTDS